MRLQELDFDLPAEAIAQTPAEPRDSCKLMHLGPSGQFQHTVFARLPELLEPGDTLVLNDSKVLPARVQARRETGGAAEVLFVRPLPTGWEALVRPSRRLRPGAGLVIGEGERLEVVSELGEGRWVVAAPEGCSLIALMQRYGRLPLPPYISAYPERPSSYQTVYAAALGSAAAPTAGLHFTERLIEALREHGVSVVFLTLHVGLDTFLPIREDVVEEHRIHTESYLVPAATVESIGAARRGGRRVVAVGTTATRVLETLGREGVWDGLQPALAREGSTSIYITPGYQFGVVDALLTNFHLPRSTVLALTMAFAGVERIRDAYREALETGYRFFSFGDAMLIERPRPAESMRGSR